MALSCPLQPEKNLQHRRLKKKSGLDAAANLKVVMEHELLWFNFVLRKNRMLQFHTLNLEILSLNIFVVIII